MRHFIELEIGENRLFQSGSLKPTPHPPINTRRDHARICPNCGAPVIATIKRKQKAALIGLGIRLALSQSSS